ncbi:MAG: HK97 family phage prohead protease [Evtepia gabavorous]
MERQQPSRTPEGNRHRDKDHGTRSMGQILSREEQPQESRRRTISFSSEEPYRRFFGMEILDHGENAVDLSRLNSVGVLLFNHNTDKVVGKVIRAWVENHRGMAEVEFDTDDDAEKIFGKVRSGTLKTTSVRYSVDAWEEVVAGKQSADGRFTGPCQIARKWTPLEVSVVSVPADPTVGVGRADTGQTCAPSPCMSDRSKQTKI